MASLGARLSLRWGYRSVARGGALRASGCTSGSICNVGSQRWLTTSNEVNEADERSVFETEVPWEPWHERAQIYEDSVQRAIEEERRPIEFKHNPLYPYHSMPELSVGEFLGSLGLEEYEDKFKSWEQLRGMDSVLLKKAGIESVKDRKKIRKYLNLYMIGCWRP